MDASPLPSNELARALRKEGIYLQTGAFTTHIRSTIPDVAEGLALLYSDYPILTDVAFADFHVNITRPANIRRWLRPQAVFLCDGVAAFKPLPLDQAFPMLEWGLNWCVTGHAHQYLMIHAAVMEKGGRAAILPAPPGSGKSTLCAGLVSRGWRLLSDEITLVRLSDGAIVPNPRPISLKNASIDVIRGFAPESIFSRHVVDTVKGTVAHVKPPQDSVIRAHEPAQPAWIVFPKYQHGASPLLSQLPRSRALLRMADNAFNYNVLGRSGFEALAALINRATSFDFFYSNLEDAVRIFAELENMDATHAP